MTALTPAERDPGAPLLRATGLTKRFPGVVALDDVGLEVRAGECVAVVGENGAGKSTLMKVLAGIHEPDAGSIAWRGEPVRIDSVQRAGALGIVLIHQELELCENLSVGANVLLGREPHGRFGWMSPRGVDAAARPFLERVGLRVAPSASLASLAIGQQQLVEIAKALSQDAALLIMDEPTSSLSFEESERLFGLIEDLRAQGVAILYISHRLEEVERLADRVVGMRDGRNSGELRRGGIDARGMVRLMVGRDLEVRPRQRHGVDGPPRLRVRGLRTTTWPGESVDLEVRSGEIVGLAGLVGSGRTEFLETLFGARPAVGVPAIEVAGRAQPTRSWSIRAAVAAGLALVPEDRKRCGAVLEMTIRENATLASLPEHKVAACGLLGVLDRRKERDTAETVRQRLGVRCASVEQRVAQLSGGNQQKVVLGKWLTRDAGVLLLDEPTRGVDVAAKDEIYQRMEELAARGVGLVFASSELPEVLALADRILVFHDGAVVGELPGDGATEEQVMQLAATGVGARAEESR